MVCTWRRRARRPDMDAPGPRRRSEKIKYPSSKIESEYFQKAHRLNFGATYPKTRHGEASISPKLKAADKNISIRLESVYLIGIHRLGFGFPHRALRRGTIWR